MVKKSDNRHPRDGGCRKKPKSLEPQRHKGTKAQRKLFLFAHAAQASPKKLCVFVPSWFNAFLPFPTTSFSTKVVVFDLDQKIMQTNAPA